MNGPPLRAVVTAAAIVGVLVCGCGSPPPADVDYTLHVSNGTTMALVVDGQALEIAPIRSDVEYAVGQLPRLPWIVEARTFPGRLVLRMNVQLGSVIDAVNADGSRSHQAPGARVDLSCGRLDVYVGATPVLGPAPGPGVPGDCVP